MLVIYGCGLLLTLICVAMLCPDIPATLLVKAKRHWRRQLIHRKGSAAARTLEERFRLQAKQKGFNPALVEQVIADHHAEIVTWFGEQAANDLLGETTLLEQIL